MRNLDELGITFDVEYPPSNLNLSVLEDFENEMQVNLPKDYRDFLLYANGGFPRLEVFSYKNGTAQSLIEIFFSLTRDEDDKEGVVFNTKALREQTELSSVAIGQNGGGNILFLNFSSEEPTVHMLFQSNFNATPEVAKSFGDFIDKLELDPELIDDQMV